MTDFSTQLANVCLCIKAHPYYSHNVQYLAVCLYVYVNSIYSIFHNYAAYLPKTRVWSDDSKNDQLKFLNLMDYSGSEHRIKLVLNSIIPKIFYTNFHVSCIYFLRGGTVSFIGFFF